MTKPNTFALLQDISNMKNVISRVKGSQPAPILLVANKLDLECQREVSTSEGNIQFFCVDKFDQFQWNSAYFNAIFPSFFGFSMNTGRELAAAWDCPFIEASAKDRINVNDVFASVVREMNMTSEKRQQKSYCCCTLL